MAKSATPLHRWRFFRAGDFDQVKLETGADLMNLDQLDQKLWVALACPLTGLEFDAKTAALIDTDLDGRIRAPELIAAVKWAGSVLKNPDDLIAAAESLPLAAINDAGPEGRHILAAVKQILATLGRKDANAITLADATDGGKILAAAPFNGDGIIVLESADDESTKSILSAAIACVGSVTDHSGKPGIDQAKADAFFAECAAFDGWMRTAEKDPAILPAGEGTAAAFAAVNSIKGKVDDYFGRCRLAAFDPRTAALVNRKEEDYAAIVSKDMSINVSEVAGFPLAQVVAGKPLPLQGAVNPSRAGAVAALRDEAIKPLLGARTELTEADWAALQDRLAPFAAWTAGKAGAAVEGLGVKRVREILAGPARAKIDALIARDKALENEAAAIAGVEKLTRYVRDLHKLCLNFVNFKNLYGGDAPAIFQMGVLYLDQRSCQLCLAVDDAAKHSVMAGLAGAFLAYVDCFRKGTGEKLSIVAIFSQGDDEDLMVGRNGIFYDRKGRDYDATITKILPNPVSLRQAFWSPYKKAVRLIEEQVNKRASTAEAAADAEVGTAVAAGPAAPPKRTFDPSVIALVSVALGSLAAAFAGFLGYLKGIAPWQLPLIALGVLLLISGPSVLLAYIKLRKRNLGPILDANGWAINTKARINVPFGARLTDVAKLPPGASVDLFDRYAEKTAAWPRILAVLFCIWWIYAFMDDTGWLYRLTSSWDVPIGKPPASLVARPEPPRPAPPASTNSVK
jgi:hypothetical protein